MLFTIFFILLMLGIVFGLAWFLTGGEDGPLKTGMGGSGRTGDMNKPEPTQEPPKTGEGNKDQDKPEEGQQPKPKEKENLKPEKDKKNKVGSEPKEESDEQSKEKENFKAKDSEN